MPVLGNKARSVVGQIEPHGLQCPHLLANRDHNGQLTVSSATRESTLEAIALNKGNLAPQKRQSTNDWLLPGGIAAVRIDVRDYVNLTTGVVPRLPINNLTLVSNGIFDAG